MKISVLLISFVFSPNLGGIETHLDDLCKQLMLRGHQVTVLTYQPLISPGWAPIKEVRKNLTVIRLPWVKGLYQKLEKAPLAQILYLIPPLLLFSIFYVLFNRKKIHIIQTHGFNMAIVGCVLSFLYTLPFVVNTHVSFQFNKDTMYAKILKYILQRAKKILVLTDEAKHELVKIGIHVKKIGVYHYWVDDIFRPRDTLRCRSKLKLPRNSFIVLFVGRFIPEKGLNIILEVSKKLKQTVFILIGSGSLEQTVKQHLKIYKNTIYPGLMDRTGLVNYYNAADVCLVPSLEIEKTYNEGIPRVMIESLSCGTPIVASGAGGLKNYITSHVGYVIHPDAESLSGILEQFIHDRKKLKSLKENCISLAKSEFGKENNIKIIEETLY